MKNALLVVCAFFYSVLYACAPNDVAAPINGNNSQPVAAFDAIAAWDEFEGLLRLHYAYIERDDFDVDAQLAHSARLAKASKTDAEFRLILHRTAYAFTDPHFIVGPFADDDYNIIPTSSDLKVAWQGEKLVIVDVRTGSVAAKHVESQWFVIDIDGDDPLTASRKPFGHVVRNLTSKQLDYGANLAVNGRRKGERRLHLMTHQGEIKEVVLPSPRQFALKVAKLPLISDSPYPGMILNGRNGQPFENIGFLRINNALGNNDLITEFDAKLEKLMETDGLILDLRNTPSGGNTEVARSIIGHFIDETKAYQVHEIPSLEREFSVPRRFTEHVKPRAPYYGKPVVVLGGHWTGSMGEGIVIGMDAATDAHIIVSDMGDLLGGLRNFNLQNSSARVDFGNEALFHVNGTPREDFMGDVFVTAVDAGDDQNAPIMVLARDWIKQQR